MSFAIGAADVEAAKHLKLALDTPIVTARGVVTDAAGVAIYVGEFVYPADVVQFDVDLAGPVRL
jgi:GntR family transcriptional regulator